MKLSGWKFRRDIPSPAARERWTCARRFARLSRQRFDDLQGLIEFGFDPFHHVGMQDILGRDGEDNGLKGFGSCFEAEGFVDRGESLLRLDGDVEVNAGGFVILFVCHTVYCGCLVGGFEKRWLPPKRA
jgi:hypothetical protein